MANNINQYSSVSGCSITNGSEHEVSDFQGPNDPGQVHYTYINDEHLKTVSDGPNTYNLSYDALGRCVKRILNGTTTYYIYDGEKPIVEYNSSGTIVARNVYGKGIDEILMRKETGINDGNWVYYAHDHEGSVTHLLDGRSSPSSQTGNVIERYKYDAFGTPAFYDGGWTQLNSTAYNNRFLFTGREYAATYRQIYTQAFTFYEYRARAYNPTLGRFMSEDPKLFDAGDYNLFRYCHNDPIDFTDAMGLDDGSWARTQERQAAWSNARDAMAKWADTSNNFQGKFEQFTVGQGLTMGQVRSIDGHEVRRATPVHNIAVFHRSSNSIVFFFNDGTMLTFPAANRTVNPRGDPNRVDSNGPAPNGTFPVQPPVTTGSSISYGPYFYPIGKVGPNGERQDIARQRGVGLHAGRDSYLHPTHGCIRMNNGDISNLHNQTQNAPLQIITIGD